MCYENISWTLASFITLTLFVPVFGLVGWFALKRYRDYEVEKDNSGKI